VLVAAGVWTAQNATETWRLSIDPSGSVLRLDARNGGSSILLFEVPVQWNAGQWHQVALSWAPRERTLLYLDGQPVASGESLSAAPATISGTRVFCVGSGAQGFGASGGRFEEFYTFDRVCVDAELALDFSRNHDRAALGPINEEEEEAILAAVAENAMRFGRTDFVEGRGSQFAMGSAQYDCGVWLEIGLSATPGSVLVTAHNTVPGTVYQLWSTEDLNGLNSQASHNGLIGG
jgi:hypothetical protein